MEIASLSLCLGSGDPQVNVFSARQRRCIRHMADLYRLLTLLLATCLFLSTVDNQARAEENYPEGAVKAVMLYNLPDFAEWPAAALQKSDRQIHACLLGKMPFQKDYEPFNGRQLKGRELSIRPVEDVENIEDCHLVFITPTSRNQLSSTLESLSGKSILTISDTRDFAKAGGMIELKTSGQRIQLIINLGAAKAANIQLHSSLLDLATIVGSAAAEN